MSDRLIIAIVTTLLYELALVAVVLWGLPQIGINVPLPALAVVMLALGSWAVITYRKGSQALGKKAVSGLTTMVGNKAQVVSRLDPEGMVRIKGELWTAVCPGERVNIGEEVMVVGQEGLKLIVRRSQGGGDDKH